jgi:hypothetical protein
VVLALPAYHDGLGHDRSVRGRAILGICGLDVVPSDVGQEA